MVEVVNLDQHRLPVDKDMVESFRVLLSEVQNGRMRSYYCVYTTPAGEIVESYLYGQPVDQVALESFLKETQDT